MPPEQSSQKERCGFSARVTFTGVLTVVFLLIAAMTAAYVWGVISGRRAAFAESDAKLAPIAASPAPVADNPEKHDDILKPQELDFVHELRGDTRPTLATKNQSPKKGGGEAANAANHAPDAIASPSPSDAPPPSTASPEPEAPGTVYDHVFQMAALKDEQAVDSLREKLEGYGLRTRLERSAKLLIVLVLLRGDAARAAEVYQIARDLRLGQPLLRGKKPVP